MLLFGFVKINAGRIDVYDKNRTGQVINSVVISPTGVLHTVGDLRTSMTADGFAITHDGNNKFSVDENGNAIFAGALSAATGSFSGSIQIGSGENVFKADTNGIYLGNETFANAEFRVTPAGVLTATSANISGTITSSSGTIGGLNIQSDGLRYNDDFQIRGGELRIGGSGTSGGVIASPKLVINGNATGSQFLIFTTSGSFNLTADGSLSVAGQISADSGRFGSLTIEEYEPQASTGQLETALVLGGIGLHNYKSGSFWGIDDGIILTSNQTWVEGRGPTSGGVSLLNTDEYLTRHRQFGSDLYYKDATRLNVTNIRPEFIFTNYGQVSGGAYVPTAKYNSVNGILTVYLYD